MLLDGRVEAIRIDDVEVPKVVLEKQAISDDNNEWTVTIDDPSLLYIRDGDGPLQKRKPSHSLER